jgi:acyl-[acyl-carrier-protein]-phospholipid O-acyltransferase/long-chain-fatty-acid--[acyl-carrier-protein] ligase
MINNTITAEIVKQKVHELSTSSWYEYCNTLETIPASFVNAAKSEPFKTIIYDNQTGKKLNYIQTLNLVVFFKDIIKSEILNSSNVGILLPTTMIAFVANMSVMFLGKKPINMNYTANENSLYDSMIIAEVTTIITSKAFITKLNAKGFKLEDMLSKFKVLYVEDLVLKINKPKFIFNLFELLIEPKSFIKYKHIKKVDINDTATILFSSGSEGAPKGVELSHKNIVGNIKQIIEVLHTKENDVILGSLPVFHAFGLTVTTFLPLLEGIPVVFFPDPTDAASVGKAVSKYEATILFGTSTFFRIYAKNNKLQPIMFESLRLVVAGAEKLQQSVRDDFEKKFSKKIFEGYGTTETTPVASVNIPDSIDKADWHVQSGNKIGTVGLPMPGASFRVVDPITYTEQANGIDGMILIGGTQVMKGYYKNIDKTNEVIKTIDNIKWYVSGDKGHLDKDGFLVIVDRYSRFAKVGGEMISLTSIEEIINKYFNEIEVIAVNLPDEKKGEKIIALYSGNIEPNEIKQKLLENGVNTILIPSDCIKVAQIPKLGTGKKDFKEAKNILTKN